jgi:hypothetical protein
VPERDPNEEAARAVEKITGSETSRSLIAQLRAS